MALLFLDGPGSSFALQAKLVCAVKSPRSIDESSDCVSWALIESLQSSFLCIIECLLCDFTIVVLCPSPILGNKSKIVSENEFNTIDIPS